MSYAEKYHAAETEHTWLSASQAATELLCEADAEIERLREEIVFDNCQYAKILNSTRPDERVCIGSKTIAGLTDYPESIAATVARKDARIAELEADIAIGKRLTDGHLARIAELEAVVGKLPVYQDTGAAFMPGKDEAWINESEKPEPTLVCAVQYITHRQGQPPAWEWVVRRGERSGLIRCPAYSTREAALAAAEQGKEGQDAE